MSSESAKGKGLPTCPPPAPTPSFLPVSACLSLASEERDTKPGRGNTYLEITKMVNA